ncbi:MAG: hypothetical protein HY209_01270 [Candidatus Omnitrophica bacterium]|nr:hypothetical protein [Candidatus Omnitrophota bacterium]
MSELAFNRVILENNNRILMVLSVMSLVLNFVLVLGIIRIGQKAPLVVYAQEGQVSVLKTKSLQVDEALLSDFAKFILGQYLSFTVDSLPKQIEGIKPYLAIKPAEDILASFKNNQAAIEKNNISQQFVIDSITITKKNSPFWVEVQGVRNIHAAGRDKNMPMTYVVEVKKVKSTENNPYGFLMTDIIEKDKLNQKGQKP